ncbi:MAG: nucleotidyl transferase AbiEii/AbiGii toxin family protein, partial [archaeon]|nr:nucleotidyl transferase AbiEii/AbiGii toxin family protein [archaeon]
MNLHLDKTEFINLLDVINEREKIDKDILEKDYYVCLVLEELSKRQDELKAYFKGGTAVYKILDEARRFSEDIDLTVKMVDTDSNTRNRKRLKDSVFGYEIDGLVLDKEKSINKKGSITSFYKYQSAYDYDDKPLQRAGEVQIEATSFTVSEPFKKYTIMPLIFKFANEKEKNILKDKYDVHEFDIEIITLERMFIDKLFAAEFYVIRNMYIDAAKHLYDITILFNSKTIQDFLKNEKEVDKLIQYKREEEKARLGGIDENTMIRDFNYLNHELGDELIKELNNMQDKYVIKEE